MSIENLSDGVGGRRWVMSCFGSLDEKQVPFLRGSGGI